MKKLSLLSLFGLLAFVAMPIYAQEVQDAEDVVYAVENEAVSDEALDLYEEPVLDYGVDEDGVTLETADDEFDYYTWDWDDSSYDYSSYDLS